MCQRITKSKLKIAKALLKHAESLDWGAPVEGRHRFTLLRANKLFVGVLLDQGMDTAREWDAADWIVESIGDEESGFWESVTTIEKERLEGFMQYGWGGYALHRRPNRMSRYLQECATLMIHRYGGDPRRIWNGERCVFKVRDRFEEFLGIGPNLSRMAVLILVRDYGFLGGRDSLKNLDVKSDVLLKRVFERTGLVPSNAPDDKYWKVARKLNPDFPAALDPPAWDIGNKFCTASNPNCPECPLKRHCPRAGL